MDLPGSKDCSPWRQWQMTGPNAPYGVTHLHALDGGLRSWWSNYAEALLSRGISATSLGVIDADAGYIVDQCLFGAGEPGSGAWPETRERSGVVMGSVQSGKTASMLAVTAKALDRGVDAVVVLAGTRTALWLQTLDRLVDQLDTWEGAWSRRILLPNRSILEMDVPSTDLETLYSPQKPRVKKALARRIPIIAVVMKNVFHLERTALTLHQHVFPLAAERNSPFHLVVIDDEADDASVVDAAAEARLAALASDTKQVPRRIADLWESRATPGETIHPNVFTTYVAYTATPQANFLQDPANPLAPRDFAVSLRTPGATGPLVPRSASFMDPMGLRSWYTGGEVFYKALGGVPLCRTDDEADSVLGDALRCFIVGSAVRLWRDPARIGPGSAVVRTFGTSAEAAARFSSVASMLVHPSAGKEDHFDVAAQVLAWADGSDPRAARGRIDAGERRLPVGGIARQMAEEPEKWKSWLDEFSRSAKACRNEWGLPTTADVPGRAEWPDVERLILEEVIPGTRIAVINSDESADDRPDFEPRRCESGWGPPPNHSSIFVSGNVMARGLTLEGLTTTLFTRRSDAPLADTQMQMQRWFGYRGGFIELCRVFMTPLQLDLFTRYHEADEALRRDIMSAMDGPHGAARALTVLQGYNFAATGKIANLTGSSLWPGPTPFLRYMNSAHDDVPNARLVAEYFSDWGYTVVKAKDGRELGLIMASDLDLVATAELLDGLRYTAHGPGVDGSEAARWGSVANHLGLLASDPEFPLYRAPLVAGELDLEKDSPYWIAAYLRLWSACLVRHSPGFLTTDSPNGPWSLVDLGERATAQPRFRVGLRFGRGPVVSGPLAALGHPVRSMDRDVTSNGTLASTWGARGAASRKGSPDRYPGDEYFDYFARGESVPAPVAWGSARPPGEPGLLLLHPIHREHDGCSLAFGMSIPLGGPDQVAALPSVATS